MKQTIKIFILKTAIFFISNTVGFSFGPIFKLELTNDNGKKQNVFVGVDSLATDGYDADIEFKFGDTVLTENYDLPPFWMPGMMYCVLVRDSLEGNTTLTYVDIRSIPENENKFFHHYKLEVLNWAASMYFDTELIINWGKLPDGIDSAKIILKVLDSTIDMREKEKFILNNAFHTRFDIFVWYNKEHNFVEETSEFEIFYFIENNFLTVNNGSNNFEKINIYSLLGTKIISSNENSIDIGGLAVGIYFVELIDKTGQKIFNKFSKK